MKAEEIEKAKSEESTEGSQAERAPWSPPRYEKLEIKRTLLSSGTASDGTGHQLT